ncbi:hypothetical protein [Anaerocolumna chitinilytica]|uniref:Nucleoside 2-deoxyribosyltransferase n=1 Tax=Anaerocolumna chitinilytica TaxID=1727145 RepID=A0A7I8DL98_9FIRM|nr:hypothetical protein [Anaerocolumna chitinilytica]BCJ98094.1 hypothetical protein bsdcttw_11350 [Anaerocolumna chitinilytica]
MGEIRESKEKCFVIMPISDQEGYPSGHFQKVYDQILKPAIEEAGYVAYRVDENKICDPIINKIFDAIQNCEMAICDLSSKNPNVLYELGLRQAYDKPVVLLQDTRTEKIFDVGGINTVFYNDSRLYEDVIDARNKIRDAIIATRDGQGLGGSIVKVVKAGVANVSADAITQDEKLQIILNSIKNDLQQIKETNRNITFRAQEDEIYSLCREVIDSIDLLTNNELAQKYDRIMFFDKKNTNLIDERTKNLITKVDHLVQNRWDREIRILKEKNVINE